MKINVKYCTYVKDVMFSVECVKTLRIIVKCGKINSIIFSFLRTDHLFCVKPVQYYSPNINNHTNTIFEHWSAAALIRRFIGEFNPLTSHLFIQVK